MPDEPKELPQDESAAFNIGAITCYGGFDPIADTSIKIFFERIIFISGDDNKDGLLSFEELTNSLVKWRNMTPADADRAALSFFAGKEMKCQPDSNDPKNVVCSPDEDAALRQSQQKFTD